MTRRTERHAYRDPNGTLIRTVKFYCLTDAEADAVELAGKSVPPPHAFTPGLCAGEPFDAPEPAWPSDATARVYPPPCDGNNAGTALAIAQHIAAEEGDGCTSAVCAMTRGSGD